MSHALVIICAMVLDAVVGEPKWLWNRLPHPAVLMGKLVNFLDTRFNHGQRQKTNGIICVVFLVALGASIGAALQVLGPLVEIIATAVLLAQRSLVQHVRLVGDGLRMSLQEGRRMVARIVSRDTDAMDATQIARAAIESAAENLSDGVIAPAFWFLLAGLPGLIIYKIINTADSMIGYRTPRHAQFGWAAARLDDTLNLIPARLTALLIALVAKCPDLTGIRADASQHRSPNAGWPEAAMSRALGIALSGPRAYAGTLRDFPWVNPQGRRVLTPKDIDSSITMMWQAWAAFLGLCLLIILM